jgi:hypothetical protein
VALFALVLETADWKSVPFRGFGVNPDEFGEGFLWVGVVGGPQVRRVRSVAQRASATAWLPATRDDDGSGVALAGERAGLDPVGWSGHLSGEQVCGLA